MITEVISFAAGSIFSGLLSYLNNAWLDDFRLRRQMDGVLTAIQAELKTLRKDFKTTAESIIRITMERQEPYCGKKFVLNPNCFIVYPANTSVIGNLEDTLLVESIVQTYTIGADLVKFFEINNALLEEKIDITREEMRGDDLTATGRREFQEGMLTAVFSRLRVAYNNFSEASESLLNQISSYRTSHPVSRVPAPIRILCNPDNY